MNIPSTRYLGPAIKVILIPGETVDEEAVVRIPGCPHRTVDEAAGDLHRDDRAVLDVRLDELAELRAGFGALLAQQVAGWQVNITVTLDDVAAERALAGTRAAQDEHHLRLLHRDGGHGADGTTSCSGHYGS